jgi:hypothetical protein
MVIQHGDFMPFKPMGALADFFKDERKAVADGAIASVSVND